MNYKVAILGSKDAVLGFKVLGLEAILVSSEKEAGEKLLSAYQGGDYAIIFITEDWIDKIKNFIDELPPKALPALVAVPGQQGSTGAGAKGIKKIVEQAVGSDILSN